ncbi:UDP-glycosyltransferase 73C6 [Hordeum vulgare]|nr:UDP-glycosyltransferase 73C6 [Hordeum vulgare]
MDAHTGAPLTPLYSRDPPAAAAASAEYPSAAGVGAGAAAAAGAPPTVGLARSLFLPPRMTTPTGGVASALSRAAAAPLERKKGKTSAKKKTTDGSGSSKPKKKVAVRRPGAASTEAPASSLVEPAEDAHHVFDEMPPSLNDDAYMSTMGVGSNNSHWSQTNDIHLDDHEFEYNIAQNLFKEETRTIKKGNIKKGKIFTLPHCYEVLKDDEKWKKREDLDDLHLSNKHKSTIELNDDEEEDDASTDDDNRSPTPNSVSYSKPKRPNGCKKDKPKRRRGKKMMSSQMLWTLL